MDRLDVKWENIRMSGACMVNRLGACMRLLGAKYAETFGCMYAVVGCISDSG